MITTVEMILGLAPEPHPSFSMADEEARTAVVDREISHPNVAIHDMAAGTLAPSTPKMARVSTMVGALPRLPAIEMMPTSKKEMTTPAMVVTVACQKEMPKPKAQAPYDMAKTEMLAENQGQKRLDGLPLRSDSAMVSIPWASTLRAELLPVPSLDVLCSFMMVPYGVWCFVDALLVVGL